MFSGIIEALSPALSCEPLAGAFRLRLERPSTFDDLRSGDSVAVDGVCLTVENFDERSMTFVLAAETIRVLGFSPDFVRGRHFNLERSLRFGDRLHGHMVSGHVDSRGEIVRVKAEGESLFLDVRYDRKLSPYLWRKGSVALNGVSLTINSITGDIISVCLIPETRKRTNLDALKVGDAINIEPDLLAKAVARAVETGLAAREELS